MKTKSMNKYKSNNAVYEVVNELGMGGNGVVYRVKSEENNYALKLLRHRKRKDSVSRFVDEISVLKRLRGVDGVVPMLDYYISRDKNVLFFVMPIAELLTHYAIKKDKDMIVVLFWELAITLNNLCKVGIHHRDIKPSNIFYYDDSVCISDFGLAEFPDKKDVTPLKGKLGPERTMAPEMRRSPGSSEGEKADVYSFAKTFYILLTENEDCFDGKYDSLGTMFISKFCKFDSMQVIEQMIELCTEHDPEQRPSFVEIIKYFELWHSLRHNMQKKMEYGWKYYQNKLFPHGTPENAQWHNKNNILNILKIVAKTSHMNHVLFPDGGGLDLLAASIGPEPNTLELNIQGNFLLSPRVLYYESFHEHPNDNYFLLELNKLKPIAEIACLHSERLTCLSPLNYAPGLCWSYNDYDGNDLPVGSRMITRILDGKLLFLSKSSLYNSIPSTYDGGHSKLTNDQLRNIIEHIYRVKSKLPNEHQYEEIVVDNCSVCSYSYPKKFKLKRRLLTQDEIDIVNKFTNFLEATPFFNEILTEQNDGFDFDYEKYILYKNLKVKVVTYLKQLNYPDLVLIAAVMSGGREYTGGDFGDPLDLIMETNSKDSNDLAQYVAEKIPVLVRYLAAGIKLYS